MTTKLEAMVGYLAGRDGNDGLRDELADPSSEASRFLEATWARSRAILEISPVSHTHPEPIIVRTRSGIGLGRLAWGAFALLVLGVTLWVGEARIRHLETTLERARVEDQARSERLEAALSRLAQTTASAAESTGRTRSDLGQFEANLERLTREIQGLASRPEAPSKLEPALADLRDRLETLHRDLAAGEKTSTRRAEELQATAHEVVRLVRLLVNRSQPPDPANENAPRRNP